MDAVTRASLEIEAEEPTTDEKVALTLAAFGIPDPDFFATISHQWVVQDIHDDYGIKSEVFELMERCSLKFLTSKGPDDMDWHETMGQFRRSLLVSSRKLKEKCLKKRCADKNDIAVWECRKRQREAKETIERNAMAEAQELRCIRRQSGPRSYAISRKFQRRELKSRWQLSCIPGQPPADPGLSTSSEVICTEIHDL